MPKKNLMLIAALFLATSCSSDSSNGGGNKDASISPLAEAGTPGGGNGDGASSTVDQGGSNSAGDSKTSQPQCGVVPKSFTCPAFNASEDLVAGGADCSTEQVHQFYQDCWNTSTATSQTCAPWAPDGSSGLTACGQCLTRWTDVNGMPDTQKCIYLYIGATTNQALCRDAYKCFLKCGDSACNNGLCDETTKDSNGETELDRCYNLDAVWGATGTCATLTANGSPVGSTANSCLNDSTYKSQTTNCKVTSLSHIERFFRGACRDNADWSNAANP